MKNTPNGSGFWKFNSSLLNNETFSVIELTRTFKEFSSFSDLSPNMYRNFRCGRNSSLQYEKYCFN